MRNKVLAVVVALGGFASLAAISMTAAQASSSTQINATAVCPSGNSKNVVYCYYVCPSGYTINTANDIYCELVSTTTVTTVVTTSTTGSTGTTTTGTSGSTGGTGNALPQGPPTLFRSALWGAKLKFSHQGPALKFHVRSGINGAPGLASLTLTLPSGLSFASSQKHTLAVNGPKLQLAQRTVTFKFRSAVASVLVYLKNHSMVESQTLREELAFGKITTLTFHVVVTDAAGRVTRLAFSVAPRS